jgi:hypothetical protein
MLLHIALRHTNNGVLFSAIPRSGGFKFNPFHLFEKKEPRNSEVL